jgi:MoaA/NifB/PqqE/SkfB family radical SAM enzyme
MLGLTGGDLLKRPDVYELIEYATWRGVDVSMTLCATPLVTDAAIHRLRGAGISRLAISLDAGDAMTHDGLWSVPGIFDRTLRILSTARAEGIYTQINTTITPVNFDQVDALANLLAGHQISVWCVVLLVPVGRAAFEPRLSAEQCEQLFEKLWQHTQRQPYAINTTAAPHYRRYVLQHRRHSDVPPFACVPLGMIDGKGVMFIGHTGLIHPSGFMPIVCGLFPLDHLVHVYQRSPIFRGLRDPDRLEGKCHVCEFRKVCGGSRARAYAVTGNPFAQEPDCSYEPMAWK